MLRRLIFNLLAVNLLFVGAAMLGGRTWGEWLVVEFGIVSSEDESTDTRRIWVDVVRQVEYWLPSENQYDSMLEIVSEDGRQKLIYQLNEVEPDVLTHITTDETLPISDVVYRFLAVDWDDGKVYFQTEFADTHFNVWLNMFDINTRQTTQLLIQPQDWHYSQINPHTNLSVLLISDVEPDMRRPHSLVIFDTTDNSQTLLRGVFSDGFDTFSELHGKFDLHETEPLVAFLDPVNLGEVMIYDERVGPTPTYYPLADVNYADAVKFWTHPDVGTWMALNVMVSSGYRDIVMLKLDTSQAPPVVEDELRLSDIAPEIQVSSTDRLENWQQDRLTLLFAGQHKEHYIWEVFTMDLRDQSVQQVTTFSEPDEPSRLNSSRFFASRDDQWIAIPTILGVQIYDLATLNTRYDARLPSYSRADTLSSRFSGWVSLSDLD